MLTQTHDLLTSEAKELPANAFAEHLAVAQEMYGIAGLEFTGTDVARVDRALALQINLQVAGGVESELFQSLSRGGRSFTFKDKAGSVSKTGRAIIRDVIGPGYGFDSIPSVRGHGNRKRSLGWN